MSCPGQTGAEISDLVFRESLTRRWLLNDVNSTCGYPGEESLLALKGFRSINTITYKVYYVKV